MAAPEKKSNILLVGAGGVGTMAAYALETGGRASVTAVLRSNYAVVQDHGFSIDSLEHGHGITGFRPSHIVSSVPSINDNPNAEPFEYIIVSTKNIPDVRPTVADLIRPAVTPGVSIIVLLQNGLNIEKPLIAAFPANIVLSGVSLIGASESPPGHIIHEDNDITKLGPFPHPSIPPSTSTAAAKRLIALYNASGNVEWIFDAEVPRTRWRKLVYNSSLNPLSALLGLGVTSMRQSHSVVDDLIMPCMREIVAVAAAAGYALEDGVEDAMLRTDPVTADFVPSMGQDVRKGGYVEVETIVGEPVREAERLCVEVPTLRVVYGLLRGLQWRTMVARGYAKAEFGPENPYG